MVTTCGHQIECLIISPVYRYTAFHKTMLLDCHLSEQKFIQCQDVYGLYDKPDMGLDTKFYEET